MKSIFTADDRDFAMMDKLVICIRFTAYDFDKSEFEKLKYNKYGVATVDIDGLDVRIRKGGRSKKKSAIYFTYEKDDINFQRRIRKSLEDIGVRGLGNYTDLCRQTNFVPAHVRRDSQIPLKDILSKVVPAELFLELQGLEKKLSIGLAQKFPKSSIKFYCFSFLKAEVCFDVLSPVGIHYGLLHEIDHSLSDIILRRFNGYFASCGGHRVPGRLDLYKLERSAKEPGWPSFRGDCYDGTELEVYTKQISDIENWLQRFEIRFTSKQGIKDAIGINSFSSEVGLLAILERFYDYCWAMLFPALSTRCQPVTDKKLEMAKMIIRWFHPKHSDLVIDALLGDQKKITTDLWFVSEEYISQASKAGVLVFRKVGPKTTTAHYVFNEDCLDYLSVSVQDKPNSKIRHKKELQLTDSRRHPSTSSTEGAIHGKA